MQTFEIDTPDTTVRDPQTLTVNLAGESLEVDRPKDWARDKLARAFATGPHVILNRTEGDGDGRAGAILEYLASILNAEQYRRLEQRSLDRDDPVNLDGVLQFVIDTSARWADFDPRRTTIDIRDTPSLVGPPARLLNPHLGIDITVTPPKKLFLLFSAGIADFPGGGVEARLYSMRAIFDDDTREEFDRRLEDDSDPMDSRHMDAMIEKMIKTWADATDVQLPPANRAERRAAGQQRLDGDDYDYELPDIPTPVWLDALVSTIAPTPYDPAPPDGVRASGRSWDDDPDITATLDRIESDAFMAMF